MFHIEITCAISDMSQFEHSVAEENAPMTSREPVKPTILFTNVEDPDEKTANYTPEMEPSPIDSSDSASQSSAWSIWWQVMLTVSIFGIAASYPSQRGLQRYYKEGFPAYLLSS
jgi:hypothetical protein